MEDRSGECVKLDLFIGEEETLGSKNEAMATEALCLRILTYKTKFRFGGMNVHVRSPAFEIGKSFIVNLDENNIIQGIQSYRENDYPTASSESSSISFLGNFAQKPAKIVVTPAEDIVDCELPILSADIVVDEIDPATAKAAKPTPQDYEDMIGKLEISGSESDKKKISIGVGTSGEPFQVFESLVLDPKGISLRRVKSWKK